MHWRTSKCQNIKWRFKRTAYVNEYVFWAQSVAQRKLYEVTLWEVVKMMDSWESLVKKKAYPMALKMHQVYEPVFSNDCIWFWFAWSISCRTLLTAKHDFMHSSRIFFFFFFLFLKFWMIVRKILNCLSGRFFYLEIYIHGAFFVSLLMKKVLLFLNEPHITDPVLITDS